MSRQPLGFDRRRAARADGRDTGNSQGNIILFEPTTSEHISARTIDQISVTALAPAADCRTFAIGFVASHFVPILYCLLSDSSSPVQVSKRVSPDRYSAASLYHPAQPEH